MLIEYVLNGHRKEVKEAVARALIRVKAAREVTPDLPVKKSTYQTRMLTAETPVVAALQEDGLDLLDKAQLHALAKERGLTLHHMLGADKVRAVLRGESQ